MLAKVLFTTAARPFGGRFPPGRLLLGLRRTLASATPLSLLDLAAKSAKELYDMLVICRQEMKFTLELSWIAVVRVDNCCYNSKLMQTQPIFYKTGA